MSNLTSASRLQKIISAPVNIIQQRQIQDEQNTAYKNSAPKQKVNKLTEREIMELYEQEQAASIFPMSANEQISHGDIVKAGIHKEFENTAKRADEMKTLNDYLDIAGAYEKLSKTEGLSADSAKYYSDVVDNIKKYVSQQASRRSPMLDLLDSSDYLSNTDATLQGGIGNIVLPITGDYSTKGLGLDKLYDGYKDMSLEEMKAVLTNAEGQLMDANKKIGELYFDKTGKIAKYASSYNELTSSSFIKKDGELAVELLKMTDANPNGQLNRKFGEIKLNDFMTDSQMEEMRNDRQIILGVLGSFKKTIER